MAIYKRPNYTGEYLRGQSQIYIGMAVFVMLFSTLISPLLASSFTTGDSQLAFELPDVSSSPTNLNSPAIIEPAITPITEPDRSVLSIVDIAEREYAKRPIEYDQHVLTYTEGIREDWCADFASYVYRESGQPMSNPHNGSWRIASVSSMRQYFVSQGRYRSASNYTPQPGDVAIYGNRHVNLVVLVDGDSMTTIGGNENNTIRKATISHRYGSDGLTGFGLARN